MTDSAYRWSPVLVVVVAGAVLWSVDARIDKLQKRADDAEAEIAALKTTVEILSADATECESKLDDLDTKVDEAESKIDDLESRVSDLE